MNASMRRFGAILAADLRERTRSTRFWVVLCLMGACAWWCFPPVDATYQTVGFGDNGRGLYTSAWIGMVLALMSSTMLSLFGFYLVRGTLVRDFDTRVWQLLVATPMTRGGYLLAKWFSHVVVFSLVMALAVAIGALAQFVRGEDRSLQLVELLKPVLVIGMPALCVTAACAVLFDLVPWLRRTAGNVLYFFTWLFVFIASVEIIDPEKVSWAKDTWISDPNGLALAMRDFKAQLATTAPWVKTSGIAIGVNYFVGKPAIFLWSHWQLRWIDVLGRLLWVGASMLGMLALAPALDRAAANTRAVAGVAGAGAGRRLRWLDPLLRLLEFSAPGALLAAELKLVLRQRRAWWWLAMTGLAIVQAVGTREAIGIAAIGAWLVNVDVFARAVLRERDTGTGALVFVAEGAVGRLLVARIGAALVLAVAAVGAGLLHLLFVEPLAAASLFATALGVGLAGLAIGAACRNPRPFELMLVALSYAGVQAVGPLAAVARPGEALAVQGVVLPASLVALAVLWPRLARAR